VNKAINKKKLVLILSVIIAIIGFFFVLITRVPDRITALYISKNSDLPYNILSVPNFNNQDYITIKNYGSTNYYDKKYLNANETSDIFYISDLDSNSLVIYSVSLWPDTTLGSSRINGVYCSDPSYRLFGCSAGDDFIKFKEVLEDAGFLEVDFFKYKKSGITITLHLNGVRDKVIYFSISVNSSNTFLINY
jgi:hypothetical protein